MMRSAIVIAALLAVTVPAAAHDAHANNPWNGWTWDPWIVLPLTLSGGLYARGIARLWRKTGFGRGTTAWRALAFSAGWLCIAIALISPVHWLGERLFSVHMVEHEIVMAVGAPLLVIARPMGPLLWALPPTLRRSIGVGLRSMLLAALWRAATDPFNATVLHGIAIWMWHAPSLFNAAVANPALHRLQHLSFFVTALLFWWALFRRPSRDNGVAVVHLTATMIHTGLLGVLLTLSSRLLYRADGEFLEFCGLSPIEDQQLAGLVMWIPAGLIYAGAALMMAGLWVANSSADIARAEDHGLRSN